MAAAFAGLASPAWAATITVNTISDTTADDGFCTLREAITAANDNAASGVTVGECLAGDPGLDIIEFAIPGAGPHTILPETDLPLLNPFGTDPIELDGASQPGSSCPGAASPGDLRIILNGGFVPPPQEGFGPGDGLTLGEGNVVRGLVINDFDFSGILVTGFDNTIQCNFIGTDVSGAAAVANRDGILIFSGGNLIGTDGDGSGDAGERNVISGNDFNGILVTLGFDLDPAPPVGPGEGGDPNVVAGNFIGTDAAGTTAVPNEVGVFLEFSGAAVIGSDGDGIADNAETNVISGNTEVGVFISEGGVPTNLLEGTAGVEVTGNRIGTTADGTGVLPNDSGILLSGGGGGNSQGHRLFGRPPTEGGGGGGGPLIRRNLIANNALGIEVEFGDLAPGSEDNCIVGNGDGMLNFDFVTILFESNWWGDPSGPSGVGPGVGDTVGPFIDFDPFLTSPPAACASGTIVIEKVTDPAGGTGFGFTDTIPGSGSFSLDDGQTATFLSVPVGSYTVTEDDPSGLGFDLTALDCVDSDATGTPSSGDVGTRTASIELDAGETVICTFTNVQRGTIVVEKQTLPDGAPDTFDFSGDAAGTIGDGGQIIVADLVPGTYTSTETVPAGWDLTMIGCDDDDSSGDVGTATATFDLDPGETVTCTFSNTQRGAIVVEKQTLPDGAPGTFDFTGDAAGTIGDGGQIIVADLVPGTYTSTETVPAGWDLTAIGCDDANSSGDLGTATANFVLDPGETVTCTFTNTETVPPIVDLVNSDLDTGDGELEECEEARVDISEIFVTFDEPMDATAAGDPLNYLLVAAGPDEDFDTMSCGGAVGDDVAVPLVGASYDGGANTATLDLGAALPDSLYRLFACATLTDVVGNPLDGDGDGVGGDDFVRTFRVERLNQFRTGHFDCAIDDWDAASTAGTISYSPDDFFDSSVSGSVELFNPGGTGTSESSTLSQCVPVVAGQLQQVTGRARVGTDDPDATLGLPVTCEFFSGADCSGTSLDFWLELLLVVDTDGVWIPLDVRLVAPAGSLTALCTVGVIASQGEAFDVHLDELIFDLDPPVFFADGFESGDTSKWSTSQP